MTSPHDAAGCELVACDLGPNVGTLERRDGVANLFLEEVFRSENIRMH